MVLGYFQMNSFILRYKWQITWFAVFPNMFNFKQTMMFIWWNFRHSIIWNLSRYSFPRTHTITLHVDLYVDSNGYEESFNKLINWLWQLEGEDSELRLRYFKFEVPMGEKWRLWVGMICLKKDIRGDQNSIWGYGFLIWRIDGQIPALLDSIFGK